MKQQQFEAQHAALWRDIAGMLEKPTTHPALLPERYRRLCQTLALAIQRGYSPALTAHLQQLVNDCHRQLYGQRSERPATLLHWLSRELPCRVRAEWRLLLLVAVAFWGVGGAVAALVWWQPHWAYSFMAPDQLADVSAMYQPDKANVGRSGSEGNLMMFGFYIWNNVSIAFRSFAGGFFAGIPALVSVVLNALHIATVASWLSLQPATRATFWPFVVTHSSFELSGLMLSALAGIKLGLSLVAPGQASRRHALQVASVQMFPVLVGAALLTVLAAFVEAFWSASTAIPADVKYTVGALCWCLVIGFFSFAGRGTALAPDLPSPTAPPAPMQTDHHAAR